MELPKEIWNEIIEKVPPFEMLRLHSINKLIYELYSKKLIKEYIQRHLEEKIGQRFDANSLTIGLLRYVYGRTFDCSVNETARIFLYTFFELKPYDCKPVNNIVRSYNDLIDKDQLLSYRARTSESINYIYHDVNTMNGWYIWIRDVNDRSIKNFIHYDMSPTKYQWSCPNISDTIFKYGSEDEKLWDIRHKFFDLRYEYSSYITKMIIVTNFIQGALLLDDINLLKAIFRRQNIKSNRSYHFDLIRIPKEYYEAYRCWNILKRIENRYPKNKNAIAA